jgi:glucose-6-phosphate dehydrogenase assembly protein OpcA
VTSPSAVLARVDDELRGLWSARPAPGEMPTARARTANLVVIASTPTQAESWQSIIDDVVQNVPARAIVVGLDPDGGDALEATVSGVCAPAGGGSPAVCSERVSLIARGAMCGRVASVVDSLSLGDVATTLVWLGRVHTDDPAFAPIAEGAGRIVLDAAQGGVLSLANVVYWARSRATDARPGLADLTWTRLSIWHELCARMFDEPRLRPLASRVTSINVTQASEHGAPLGAEGGLLLAWLATRLGWKATSLAGKLRLVRADGVAVKVSLRADPKASLAHPRLQGVTMEAGDAKLSMRCQISRDDDTALWMLDVIQTPGEPAHLEHRVRLVASETARLLERTLRRPLRDDALVDAVAWADQLRGEELVCT